MNQITHDTVAIVDVVNHVDDFLVDWLIKIHIRRLMWIVGRQKELKADSSISGLYLNGNLASQLNVIDFAVIRILHWDNGEVGCRTLGQEDD